MKQEEIEKSFEGFKDFIPTECKRKDNGEPINFFKAYCDAMVRILRLTESELKIFLAMCTKAEYNTNVVDTIKGGFRDFVVKATGFKPDTIRHAIVGLYKKGFIKKVNPDSRDGIYMLNKDYAFRGTAWGKASSITFAETHYPDGKVKRHIQLNIEEEDTPFPEDDIPEHLLL
jgi:hypothetical protein